MAYSAPVEGVIAGLDIAPPAQLAVGRGTAFVLAGHCHHPRETIRRLEISVGGRLTPVDQHGLARIDVYEAAASGGTPARNALHSGFVATPVVPPVTDPQDLAVEAIATFAGGHRASVPLATLRALPRLPAVPEATEAAFPADGGPRVAICMATHDPPADLLRRQLDSIREQTHRNWICLISDESSDPAALEWLREETAGDRRFVVSHSEDRLGFYRNFERALSMAPPEADFVALSDQDDVWRPVKIERLLSAVGDALLVYSDSRLTTPEGQLISPSFWTNRRNNFTNYASLVMANSVTGAASLFRRELLADALPLPPFHHAAFHDHWLAAVALSLGRIAYVDEPLWDYTQHGSAVIGHAQANKRPKGVRVHLRERFRSGKDSRAAYYFNWQQQRLSAEVLRLRCWDRMPRAKRRTLARLISADRRLSGLAWLLGRRARRLWGADETLDRELVYGYALAGRRAVSAWTFARRRPGRFGPRDLSVPDSSEP
jgi:glycosyltransferase involved in cell wall biosynthesis